MPSRLRIITRRTLVVLNIITAVLYLLSCLAPYIRQSNSWVIAVLGLAFPILLALLIGFIFLWLILKLRRVWFSILVLLAGYKSIGVFWAFNTASAFQYQKKTGHIRIATWNVARFLEWKRNNNEKSQTRLKMLDQIQKQAPDILCLEEFFHSPVDSIFYNNISEITAMGYPYHYFSYDPDGDYQFIGSAIFSKYPMLDTGLVRYFRPSMTEALVHADIKVNDDTIRVFATHLQSVQFRQKDYEAIDEITTARDSLIDNSKTVLAKLRKAMSLRGSQADVARQVMDDSPYPTIFCGDLNDTPNSYTYFTIRGDMQDAFLKKGFGIGRTFSSLSPTLRIDYIFADENFRISQFTRVVKYLSDHFMLMADVELKQKK
ncbi:MAG TPA: endonuclease/exonuclease/phosphatase family protein [Chitinophagaceae bacterium]|jgi:endonuclease/exonuclease/phosphatase family metal-dependent hydrolase|nr:endonuclease/exonuclease/phosphatase family protein [Chitinophagaceae bacterium]